MSQSRSTNIDRLPPHSVEAEEAVLGSVLIDPEAIYRVNSYLKGEHFYIVKNQWVWEACLELLEHHDPIDFVTITKKLAARNQLDEVGGPAYISHLINAVPTAIHVEGYGQIVARTARRRKMLAAASTIAQLAYDEARDDEEVFDLAEQAILNTRPTDGSHDVASLATILNEYSAFVEYRYEHQGQPFGVPTGLIDLDRMLGGLPKSDLIITAARPGLGKTSLMLNMALAASRRFHQRVMIFSLEMSKEQIVERLVAQESGIDSQRLRFGNLQEEDWPIFVQTTDALSTAGVWIDDTPGLTAMQLRSKARRTYAEHGLDLIVVDYLQLMTSEGRSENRNQELSQISRALKNLARELNIPVLVASQLSRAVEQRADKRPLLSDLRDSGAIEQDSDVIMFIYREGAYNDACENPNLTELIIAKHRQGPTGTVELYWKPTLTQFCSAMRRDVQL